MSHLDVKSLDIFHDGQEEDQIDRKSFNFNHEETKSKIKKTKKNPLQNIWGLPLEKFTREKLLIYMMMFHEKTDGLQKIYELEPGFAEMVCSALHNHWNDQKLVAMALVNVVSVTQIATNEVKRTLFDEKIILAAIITICLQRDYLKYTSEVDDAMEQVLLLLYYGTEKDLGKPVRIDSRIIEAILTLAPYVCAHLERRDSIEEFFWLLRHMLVTMHEKYDLTSRKIVHDWLSKHGVVSFVRKFMVKYSFKHSLELNLDFMRVVDIAFLLREDPEFGDIYSIIPNLFQFLKFKVSHPLRNSVAVDYKQTANIVILMFQHIVQNMTISGLRYLMNNNFLKKMTDSLVINRYYPKITEGIAQICGQMIAKISSLVETESQSLKAAVAVMLKGFCEQLELFIAPACDLKLTCSYLFYLTIAILQLFPGSYDVFSMPEDNSIVVMIKALAIVCDFNHVKETDRIDSVTVLVSTKERENFLGHFFAFIQDTAYQNEGHKLCLKMSNIVNDLPEIMSHFIDVKVKVNSEFAEAMTRFVLLFSLPPEDFFSSRWEHVHHLMLSYYLSDKVNLSETIHATKLLFMWKLLNMSRNEEFVSSIMLLEVDLRESGSNSCKVKEVIEQMREGVKSKEPVKESSAEDNSEKYFSYLISDIKSVLMNPEVMFNSKCHSISELREITYIMFKIAQNFKEECHVKLLKSLTFWALDFAKYQNDDRIEANVNKFIVYLYLKCK